MQAIILNTVSLLTIKNAFYLLPPLILSVEWYYICFTQKKLKLSEIKCQTGCYYREARTWIQNFWIVICCPTAVAWSWVFSSILIESQVGSYDRKLLVERFISLLCIKYHRVDDLLQMRVKPNLMSNFKSTMKSAWYLMSTCKLNIG